MAENFHLDLSLIPFVVCISCQFFSLVQGSHTSKKSKNNLLCLLENRFQMMNCQNRPSSNFSDNQDIIPSHSPNDGMDVDSSIADSDHQYSLASISIYSDENPEHFDEESLSSVADNQRDFEEENPEDEEEENRSDVHSESSGSLHDEMDLGSNSDDDEAALEAAGVREALEEAHLEENVIDGDVPYQYSVEEQSLIIIDESENGSEPEEEQEKATIEDEFLDDEIEVGSEHSEQLEIGNAAFQYSTVAQSWFEFSDSESETSSDNEGKLIGVSAEGQSETSLGDINEPTTDGIDDPIVIEDDSVDANEDMVQHNDEESVVEAAISIIDLTSNLSAEENEERRRNYEFLQSAPVASSTSDSASSLTSSGEAEFKRFIQRTREYEAGVVGQEIAGNQMDVPEVVPVMVEEQGVAGNGGDRLDVVIANGGIQPQMLSSQITYDWLHKHF